MPLKDPAMRWLHEATPLTFHRRGFDVAYDGRPPAKQMGALALTGEGWGVVLRAGAIIGHGALYAAAVSRTGGVPVGLQCYQGLFAIDAQDFRPYRDLQDEEVAAIEARFAHIDTADIEQAGGVALSDEDKLLVGAAALQAMQEFRIACDLRPEGGRYGFGQQ